MFVWFSRLVDFFRSSLHHPLSFLLHTEAEPLRVSDPIILGDMAGGLLRHPLLNAILAGIGERYRGDLEQVKLGDTDGLRLAHMRLHVLNDFVSQLQARIGNGKLEASRIEAAKDRAAGLMRIGGAAEAYQARLRRTAGADA
jgi:tartrate dehydratase beta subunit/fumarate hydratase class I family protein